MIEVLVNINRKEEIASVQAVRQEPENPKEGDICVYEIYLHNESTGITIKHPYGDGIELAKIMLDAFSEMTKKHDDRKKAPWKDFAGGDIYDGNRLIHPDGTIGKAVFITDPFNVTKSDKDRWKVNYHDGSPLSALSLQIGYKGQAVIMG